jgi:hypothetical protein
MRASAIQSQSERTSRVQILTSAELASNPERA